MRQPYYYYDDQSALLLSSSRRRSFVPRSAGGCSIRLRKNDNKESRLMQLTTMATHRILVGFVLVVLVSLISNHQNNNVRSFVCHGFTTTTTTLLNRRHTYDPYTTKRAEQQSQQQQQQRRRQAFNTKKGQSSLARRCSSLFLSLSQQQHEDFHSLFSRHRQRTLAEGRLLTTPRTTQQRYRSSTTQLESLNKLMEDIHTPSSSKYPKLVFVGGKGGVGKTSISSALAVELASNVVEEKKVLIVSTDPAHSLGDALDVNLRDPQGQHSGEPIMLTDSLTGGRLYGCEIDPSLALESFQSRLQAFNIETLSESLGVSSDFLENLGLREFSNLLKNPPPGLDELIALSNVLDVSSDEYDVVIVDTAPTGHTLRMLALPQFLDGLLGKLIKLRLKLSGISNTLQAFMGNEQANQRAQTIDDAMSKLEDFKNTVSQLRSRLKDHLTTNFVVVTVPTTLGIAESQRLIGELTSQGVSVTDIVVNQCVVDMSTEEEENGDNKFQDIQRYYEKRRTNQQRWIHELQQACKDVSSSEEYQSNNGGTISVTEVPYFDVELVGTPALSYIGQEIFKENPSFESLLGNNDEDSNEQPKFIICGGKGGVGKTTTSSSLAVTMANEGHNVAIVSTDPAHSLGDALQMSLKGGSLQDVPLYTPTTGSLKAMEIDPANALKEFKGIVDSLVSTTGVEGDAQALQGTLKELGEIFDTLPAGTDEVVALAKVINLVKKGDFDRIVLDTAPTGHTLRMLSTPSFIAELIDRVLILSDKINNNPTIRMFLKGAAKGRDIDAIQESARATLLNFQLQMYDLEDLFSSSEQTEFCIVTIPTELATRESIRLLNDLTFEAPDMPIKVRNVIVNQVLQEEDASKESAFVKRLKETQSSSIKQLSQFITLQNKPITMTKVGYLDAEPRGVFGLKALAYELTKPEDSTDSSSSSSTKEEETASSML